MDPRFHADMVSPVSYMDTAYHGRSPSPMQPMHQGFELTDRPYIEHDQPLEIPMGPGPGPMGPGDRLRMQPTVSERVQEYGINVLTTFCP